MTKSLAILCLSLFVLPSLYPTNLLGQNSLAGKWRCYLECPGGQIRFGISVVETNDRMRAFVTNGSEKIEIPKISVKQKYADVSFVFDHYDSTLKFGLKNEKLVGTWRKTRGANKFVTMNFFGTRESLKEYMPTKDDSIDGRWQVKFEKSEDPAVGIFSTRNDGTLAGTFLTTTGDYRFLDGQMRDGTMELSCFDGAHAFLFRAKLNDSGILLGDFWSSNTWHEKWVAKKDPNARLPDAFKQTVIADSHSIDEFQFPDLDGKPTSLLDRKFSAPARMIYVFGSWCPNCHDAAAYFKQLKDKYGEDLSILGLAFEMTGNFDRDAKQVRKYLDRHGVDYPVLIAGLSDKKLATQSIPFLDRVRSYPTTIFLNRKNEIIAIHTGFTGPATGNAFDRLKSRFEEIIEKQIAK